MALSEFELIARFFTRAAPDAELGVGDDAALLLPAPGMELAVSTDLLVAGTHFFVDTGPRDLGWKTLAVNVSDLAAMGAQPRWATLGLTLPAVNEAWLAQFAAGFFECAERFGVQLVGGDTTRGPLALAVTILGEVPCGLALRRSGAQAGDDLWVSGQPGRAALGLAQLLGHCALDEPTRAECVSALQRPQPRLELGLALRGLASAAIDVSDGLLADLRHVLRASQCGAVLTGAVPPAPTFTTQSYFCGGDDYELLFSAPANARDHVAGLAEVLGIALRRIGTLVTAHPGEVVLHDAQGQVMPSPAGGWDHFA